METFFYFFLKNLVDHKFYMHQLRVILRGKK